MPDSVSSKPRKSDPARDERRAEQLRANLLRRKRQSRARLTGDTEPDRRDGESG